MENLVRREVVETAETFVIKIGTNVLSCEDDTLDLEKIQQISEQIHLIRKAGKQVVLVSSGAVGAGMGLLSLKERPKDLRKLQAAAATGQAHLIKLYDNSLSQYGYHAAQLLLTANDFRNRSRYLNVRNTIQTLFDYGVVPVINENDTVSVDEIKFGDNDHLAAMVTNLIESPLLVILSVVDGLFDGDPDHPQSQRISIVKEWDDDILNYASDATSKRGTGGMKSKLQAVLSAIKVGENVIIADGNNPVVLEDILNSKDVGTLFIAKGESVPAWKRWIGYTITPRGQVIIDEGAEKALIQNGRSLLPIGVTKSTGMFEKGEIISILNSSKEEIARGLTNFGFREVDLIAGKQSTELANILPESTMSEVVHRDNLVILNKS